MSPKITGDICPPTFGGGGFMYPADDSHSLLLTDLLGLWSDRSARLDEQREATAAFRAALRAAVDEDNVPVRQVANALGISRRGVRRHLDAARAFTGSS